MYKRQDLNDIAQHCSLQAEMAQMVATAVTDLKVCQYMEPHVGEKLAAVVQRVSRPGMQVLLKDYNVLGFLPSSSIGDKAVVKGPTLQIQAGRRMFSFTEGHPIGVRLTDVDFIKLQLLLELA